MLSEYGFDLVEEWETVTARRLWVLIQGLPPDSALWREDAWTRQDEFAAAQLELTDGWSRLLFEALGGKVRGEALQIDRPGEKEPDTLVTDRAEIAAWFAANR